MLGVETELPYEDKGLHFWMKGGFPGYFWHFPCRATTRFGVGTYAPSADVKGALREFLRSQFSLSPGPLRGGYIPTRLRAPVVDSLFMVGDAAGHCFGFTAEGIRMALHFGRSCGVLIQNVLDGRIDKGTALRLYQREVDGYRQLFRTMAFLQAVVPRLPTTFINGIATAIEVGYVPRSVLTRYARP
jgi:menaquinone-9 beta-reductase